LRFAGVLQANTGILRAGFPISRLLVARALALIPRQVSMAPALAQHFAAAVDAH
jgi:hypothetical protein